mgnify:CR=1 FL=1
MKTNIKIELNDEQRILIGQRFYKTKSKKKITRADLNIIVNDYILNILKKTHLQITEKYTTGIMSEEWTSLTSLKNYFEKSNEEQVIDFDGFSLTTNQYIYTLALGRLERKTV